MPESIDSPTPAQVRECYETFRTAVGGVWPTPNALIPMQLPDWDAMTEPQREFFTASYEEMQAAIEDLSS